MTPKKSKPRTKATPALASAPQRVVQYKVVELSLVDEHSLQTTLNEWTPRGWAFDGVQFAMRESSKRPSMAFVFFTRETDEWAVHEPTPASNSFRSTLAATKHLEQLTVGKPAESAWERAEALAATRDFLGKP